MEEGRKRETKDSAEDSGICYRVGEMVLFTETGNTGERGSLERTALS